MKIKVGDKIQFDWKNEDSFEWTNGNHWAKVCIQVAQHVDLLSRGYDASESWNLCRFTHTGTVIEVLNSDYVVAEALNGGYTFINYDKRYMHALIEHGYCTALRPNKKLNGVKEFAESMEGYPYDWKAIIKLGIGTLFRVIPLANRLGWILPYLHIPTDKVVICSEANSRLDYHCSKGKVNMPNEFQVGHDRIMPVHYTISKQYEVIKNGG